MTTNYQLNFNKVFFRSLYPLIATGLLFYFIVKISNNIPARDFIQLLIIYLTLYLIITLPYILILYQYLKNDFYQNITLNNNTLVVKQKSHLTFYLNSSNIKSINYVTTNNSRSPLSCFSLIEIVTTENKIISLTSLTQNFDIRDFINLKTPEVFETPIPYIRKNNNSKRKTPFSLLKKFLSSERRIEKENLIDYYFQKYKNKDTNALLKIYESNLSSKEAKEACSRILKAKKNSH